MMASENHSASSHAQLPLPSTTYDPTHFTIESDHKVSISPVDEIPFAPVRGLPFGSPQVMAYGYFVLLIGPTGSGKSSYIEALGDTSLGISKDQLEGMTQEVQAYQLLNTKWVTGENIYLIDTPGLADEKISEIRLFRLITGWMKQKKIETIHRILYFDRITDIRMSSSRWRSIETLIQAIQGFDQSSNGDANTLAITHVTTMWDTIINDNQRKKVEVRFDEVKQSISEWHALPDTALHLSKFENTHISALSILDFRNLILIRGWKKWEPFQSTRNFSPDDMNHTTSSNKRFGSFLYQALSDRIRVTNERLALNNEQLSQKRAQNDSIKHYNETGLGDVKGAIRDLMDQREGIMGNLEQLERDRQHFESGNPILPANHGIDVDVDVETPLAIIISLVPPKDVDDGNINVNAIDASTPNPDISPDADHSNDIDIDVLATTISIDASNSSMHAHDVHMHTEEKEKHPTQSTRHITQQTNINGLGIVEDSKGSQLQRVTLDLDLKRKALSVARRLSSIFRLSKKDSDNIRSTST